VSADGPPTESLHIAFYADDQETVRRSPLEDATTARRGSARITGYYAAYVLDPDR
jgi:hypothetical protein